MELSNKRQFLLWVLWELPQEGKMVEMAKEAFMEDLG